MQLLAQTTSTAPNYDQAAGIAALLGGSTLIFLLIAVVIAVGIYFLIFKKTGYSPWFSLLVLVPFIGPLVVAIMLAFTEWPIQREVRELRARLGGGGYAPPPPYPPGPSVGAGGPIMPS